MAVIIDNESVRFLEEFRTICNKYVKDCSILLVEFKDGSTIGMKTLWEVGFGIKQIKDVI